MSAQYLSLGKSASQVGSGSTLDYVKLLGMVSKLQVQLSQAVAPQAATMEAEALSDEGAEDANSSAATAPPFMPPPAEVVINSTSHKREYMRLEP